MSAQAGGFRRSPVPSSSKSCCDLDLELRAGTAMFETIVGQRGSLRQILSHVKAVAPTNATVMITGETGTGKEVIARAIHELSPRRNRNLVKVNCAALPAGLLESELFGHGTGGFHRCHQYACWPLCAGGSWHAVP